MKSYAIGIAFLLTVLVATAVPQASVWMAGGKDLSERDTTYLSPRLAVVSDHEVVEEMFRFCVAGDLRFSKVLIRMEDRDGARIPPGAKNVVADVKIRPAKRDETGTPTTECVIDARVRTDRDQIRFAVSFVDEDGYVHLDELASEGRGVAARPVPEGAEGILLPVQNNWDEKLCFFRGDLVGPLPRVKSVEVTDTADGFHVEITPDRRSFVLRGGELPAGKRMEVRIRFTAPGTERGALVMGAAHN